MDQPPGVDSAEPGAHRQDGGECSVIKLNPRIPHLLEEIHGGFILPSFGEAIDDRVPGDSVAVVGAAEEEVSVLQVAGFGEGVDEDVPDDGVSVGHFVEHIAGVVEVVARRVEIESGDGDGRVGVEAGDDGGGVDGLAGDEVAEVGEGFEERREGEVVGEEGEVAEKGEEREGKVGGGGRERMGFEEGVEEEEERRGEVEVVAEDVGEKLVGEDAGFLVLKELEDSPLRRSPATGH